MTQIRRCPGTMSRATSTVPTDEAQSNGLSTVGAQSVSWWSVVEFVEPMLERTGSWPMAGTPDWCALDAADPVKLAAIYDAARHHILRVETQAALAETSRDISAAADWSAISRNTLRSNVYIPRRVA